jgi:sec-independent protein translocase protein TatB
MFDSIGFQELVLIGLVALLVVGPKELPLLMRKAGQWMAKMRGMAADFRATFDEMARQAELDELRKEVEALRNNNPLTEIREELSKPFDTGVDPFTPVPADHAVMTPLVEPEPIAETKPKKPHKPRAKKVVEDAPA